MQMFSYLSETEGEEERFNSILRRQMHLGVVKMELREELAWDDGGSELLIRLGSISSSFLPIFFMSLLWAVERFL
jgi:hypothetical protein